MATTVPGLRRPAPAPRRGLARHRARTGGHGIEPGMLGLMLFVATEIMFFAAFFGAYFVFRTSTHDWPGFLPNTTPPVEIEKLPVPYAGWLTVILVSSSITMQLAVVAIRRNLTRASTALVVITLLLGGLFVAGQGREWHHLEFSIRDGIFPSLFYTITGFHGLHVIGGVVAIMFVLWKLLRGDFTARNHIMMEGVSFYWHFVDVVWLGVFTTLYVVH